MNINSEFLKKFNTLDQLCQKLYAKNKKDGFDALKHFSNSLEDKNKNTLKNLIQARNMLVHDNVSIININKDALTFLQGLIDGLNRKIHNGYKYKIDSDLENLRTSNLKKMSNTIQFVSKKYKFLSTADLNDISADLEYYINKERTANTLETIKNFFFEFNKCVKNIENRNCVKSARQHHRENNLANAKIEAKQHIELLYCDVINNTSMINIVIRNRAKINKKSALSAIDNCTNMSQLYNIIEIYEEYFEDLCD